MKNGALYATKLKKAYGKLRQSLPKPELPEADDPMRRLAMGILGSECGDAQAGRALDRALSTMVDWNEMRVSSPVELNAAIGNAIPHGLERCQGLIEALQSVFDSEHCLSLDSLRNLGRREARHYLERLGGVDEYAVASVILWSLGGHAVPVDLKLVAKLSEAGLVNPSATRAEVQAFLERHVGAAEAKEFCILIRSIKPAKQSESKHKKPKAATRKSRVSK